MTRGYVKYKRKSKCFTFAAFEDKCEKGKENKKRTLYSISFQQ